MKKLILFVCLLFLTISCTTDSESSGTPTLIGKWAFGETSDCGRNMIEFKNTNVFVEYHYNSSCSLTPYYGNYILEGDLLEINTNDFVIVELTNSTLTLYSVSNDEIKQYERINN